MATDEELNEAVNYFNEKLLKINDSIDIPIEMFDFLAVIGEGAKKYSANGWLEPDGVGTSHKSMHDSMFHHLSESYCHSKADKETGLDPLLHLACRALMCYTRKKRGVL